MNSSERIVFNSIILYAKLAITIIVNLIATRLILNAMGVEDYGIVNLISGIVAMLTFVQHSMSISTQRYMSVNIGKGDINLQRQIFNNGALLHLLLGILILVILEVCLPLVFNSNIQIPVDRHFASIVLYQLTCLGTFLVVIGVPFDAILNARENMIVVSLSSIIESIIRLVGAIWLLYYHNDKLIFYGLLIVTVRLTSLIYRALYCWNKYPEVCIEKKNIRKSLMIEMFSFSLWNMFGAFATAARTQGVAVVLNIFNGVVVNTAYGLGTQVSGHMGDFSGTISKAMTPQIMQREGIGKRDAMNSLALKQCRYTTLIMFIFALPIYVEMPYVLTLWLKNVPEYAVDFCRMFLLIALIGQLSSGLMTAIQAKGKIAVYQVTISILLVLNIPIAYLLQRNGYSPVTVLWAMLVLEFICLITRLIFANILVGIKIRRFIKEVILKLSFIIIISSLVAILLKRFIINDMPAIIQLVIIISVEIVSTCCCALMMMDRSEKELLRAFAVKITNRINR